MEEEEYGLYDEEENEDDPQWRGLSPGERKTLLKSVFGNNDWYEEGQLPVFEGGSANPLFDVIAERVGAPAREIKRYYAAWLSKQGFSADQINQSVSKSDVQGNTGSNLSNFMIKDEPQQPQQQTQQGDMFGGGGGGNDFMPMPQGGQPNSDAMGMWAMMNFLTSQQRMAMQQQQFQMMQGMEQRKLDQSREEGQRREAMARDQQFMNQQMAFMREMMKKSGDDGFFDSEMKNIMKEKVVDQMLGGGGGDDWKGMVKDVLGSDTLKAAVGGIGGAIGKRSSTPAGYNVAGYNPYAQPDVVQQQQQQYQPIAAEQEMQPQTVPEPQQLDGVFFDETPQQPQQEVPTREPTSQEYQAALLDAMGQMLGPSMNDPATLNALKQQIEVSVETVMTEMPGTLPNHKLLRMTEKLLLILNMRDIGLGLKDLRSKTDIGQEPSSLVMAVVVEELRKKPEFFKIFAENTYDELLAIIEPFKNTGTIQYDFDYLLKPEVAEICRYLLAAVQVNAQQNGLPQMNA